MDFYLLSKNQKKDIDSNSNSINYKGNELYKYIKQKPKIKYSIENKIN